MSVISSAHKENQQKNPCQLAWVMSLLARAGVPPCQRSVHKAKPAAVELRAGATSRGLERTSVRLYALLYAVGTFTQRGEFEILLPELKWTVIMSRTERAIKRSDRASVRLFF